MPATPKGKKPPSARKASGSATPKRKAADAAGAASGDALTDAQEAEDGERRLAEVMSSFRNMPPASAEEQAAASERVGRLPETIKTPSIVLQHSNKVNAAADGEDPVDVIGKAPLSKRAGGHDLNEDNWAQRSQRAAALARSNEEAELYAKVRLGKLTEAEQKIVDSAS